MSEPLKPMGFIVQYHHRGEFYVDETHALDAALQFSDSVVTRVYTESQLAAARAEGRLAGLEEAAKLIAGNHLLSGSIGPLMEVGWNMANETGAKAIRALADKAEGET